MKTAFLLIFSAFSLASISCTREESSLNETRGENLVSEMPNISVVNFPTGKIYLLGETSDEAFFKTVKIQLSGYLRGEAGLLMVDNSTSNQHKLNFLKEQLDLRDDARIGGLETDLSASLQILVSGYYASSISSPNLSTINGTFFRELLLNNDLFATFSKISANHPVIFPKAEEFVKSTDSFRNQLGSNKESYLKNIEQFIAFVRSTIPEAGFSYWTQFYSELISSFLQNEKFKGESELSTRLNELVTNPTELSFNESTAAVEEYVTKTISEEIIEKTKYKNKQNIFVFVKETRRSQIFKLLRNVFPLRRIP